MNRKYLYGIIDSKSRESFGNVGVGNSEVYTIQHEDLGAVVSDIPVDYKIEIEEARTHENVLRKIMEARTVIPVGFGVIAEDEAEIQNILKRARIRFRKNLETIENKMQINVTISWKKNILAEILKENREIQALAAEAKHNKADQTIKIELGSKVKAALEERKKEHLRDVERQLALLSEGFRENKTQGDYTVMNGSFLVDQTRERCFYERLNELEEKYDKKLSFLAVGPLPPYDFTRIEIRKMSFDDVEEARRALGLSRQVSLSEINSAYEQLARRNHPDLHPNDLTATEKFKKVKKAHEILTKYCEHYLCSLNKPRVEETLLIQGKTT